MSDVEGDIAGEAGLKALGFGPDVVATGRELGHDVFAVGGGGGGADEAGGGLCDGDRDARDDAAAFVGDDAGDGRRVDLRKGGREAGEKEDEKGGACKATPDL